MQILSSLISVLLTGYLIWEIARFVPRFRKLKEDIANGDPQARMKVYWHAVVFEWVSALLAMIALGFNWSKLNPANIGLDASLFSALPNSREFNNSSLGGVLIGMAAGTVFFIILRLRANRRGGVPSNNLIAAWFRKLMPDFSALLPTTNQERLLWVVVALSAGICEEIVFRGWLLNTLHSFGFVGTALIAVGAVLFGCAHTYQKIPGVILTGLAGAFFCVLYVKTGSLLIPIILHIIVDLRFAFLPAPKIAQLAPAAS